MTFVSSIKPSIPPRPTIDYSKSLTAQTFFAELSKLGFSVYENEVKRFQNLPYVRQLNELPSIQEIFRDHWDDFVNYCKSRNIKIRDSIMINVKND